MLHILTLHLGDKWIDIQKKQIERFISEPYKVYARLGDQPGLDGWKYEKDVQNGKYIDTTVVYDKHKDLVRIIINIKISLMVLYQDHNIGFTQWVNS